MNLAGKRILIVKPSSLGDVVHTLPFVHAIKRKYPSCHIGWIVQRGFKGVIEYDPAVDEIIPIFIPSTSDPLAKSGAFFRAAKATVVTLRELRRRFEECPYDLVLDLHASFRSGLLGRTNPGGFRVGFAEAKELNTSFQHVTISEGPPLSHAVDKNLAFAQYLDCPVAPEDFRIVTGAEPRAGTRAFLEQAGIGSEDRFVYANPAARWATKLWTVEAWAELADMFIGESGVQVVFAGSPDDAPYIRSIAHRMKASPIVAAGALGLAEAVALLEAAPVYVGVDSGPMHIAAFTGTRVVALFGPTDPAKVGPYGKGHRVIRREELHCLGCRKRSCSNRVCLEDLAPRTVYRETVDLMGW